MSEEDRNRFKAYRQLGALKGAAEHAIEMLTNPPTYCSDPIESALFILRRSLEHDGTEDFYERTCPELWVAQSSAELMQQLRDCPENQDIPP